VRQAVVGGWDSRTHVVDGRWIEREPLRPDVAAGLAMETRLMPWLAPTLPLQVPVPILLQERPLVVRHRRIRGEPLQRYDAMAGRRLGQFLLALHGRPIDEAVIRGVPDDDTTRARRTVLLARLREQVLPLLPTDLTAAGSALLDQVGVAPADTLVHGDLGPGHLLVHVDRLHGVIDWTDAHVGDPALDFAWLLTGLGEQFGTALLSAYEGEVGGTFVDRAAFFHLLGPWHEVLYGVEFGLPHYVESGLAGVRARLR
jgi:aminoglycoside phosphotransferase (APT) family kinase protein